jgi:hypothetical protein
MTDVTQALLVLALLIAPALLQLRDHRRDQVRATAIEPAVAPVEVG